jgi:hypothetical protein
MQFLQNLNDFKNIDISSAVSWYVSWDELSRYTDISVYFPIPINGSPIARDKWKSSSDKWNLIQTCPTGQVIFSEGYLNYMEHQLIE